MTKRKVDFFIVISLLFPQTYVLHTDVSSSAVLNSGSSNSKSLFAGEISCSPLVYSITIEEKVLSIILIHYFEVLCAEVGCTCSILEDSFQEVS